MNLKKIKRAIISVSDKSNLKIILSALKKFNIEIISSGGSYRKIKNLKYNCIEVSNYTGFSEMLDGRVKTLHPKIHAGILNIRKNRKHKLDLKKYNISNIDLVIVDLYPFEKKLKERKKFSKLIEYIDIGGPALIRAAAKNFNDVTVISNIKDYASLVNELKINRGSTSIDFRKHMSAKAFDLTAYYDSIISNYLNSSLNINFPEKKTISGTLVENLRYGENPHQKGSLYKTSEELNLKKIHGKTLSYNNYNDIYSALTILGSFKKNEGTVVIKHANPCGVSTEKNQIKSFKNALICDPVSSFGGVVAINSVISKKLAIELNKKFFEVIVSKGFKKDALKILKKKKNLRIIDASSINLENNNNISSNFGYYLLQDTNNKIFSNTNFKIVSKTKPNQKTLKNLIFAFNICKNVKSNAIVLTKDNSTIGIGSGQSSRLDSCKIAIEKMNKFQKIKSEDQIVAASDAFFPFVDGIEKLVQAGVSAVIQPHGSINDKEIIRFANQTNTILVFSKTRHFKH